MFFRWTYTPIAMLLIRVALAQTTFIESDSSFKCQLTIIGESHFLGNLHGPIERFVASRTMKGLGTDTLNYFVELPPSAAYFLWAYINHGDSMIYRNPILKYNYLDFLRKDGGEIEHIRIIPVDLESRGSIPILRDFIKESISKSNCSSEFTRLAADIHNMTKKSIERELIWLYRDKASLHELEQCLGTTEYFFLERTLSIISQYGIIRGSSRKKGMAIRDRQVAAVLDSSAKLTGAHLLTIGSAHLNIERCDSVPRVVGNLTNYSRNDVCLILIANERLNNAIYYHGKWLRTKDEFSKLIDNNSYDTIIRCEF